jgi:hypothetical protein
MLDFIGTIVLVAAIIFSINALTGAMPISTSQRIALSVGAGLWTCFSEQIRWGRRRSVR